METAERATTEATLRHLCEEMARLDGQLQRLVAAFQAAGRDCHDLLGTFVTDADATALLNRPFATSTLPGRTAFAASACPSPPTRLSQLRDEHSLTPFEFDAFLLCLAPALDVRYERIFGYVQDDVTRKQATPNLILDVLCEPGALRLRHLLRFADDASLIKHGLLERVNADASLLSGALRANPRVVLWLLGGVGESLTQALGSARLGALAQPIYPRYSWADLVLPADATEQLHELTEMVQHRAYVLQDWGVGNKLASNAGVSALFSGPPGTGKTMAAEVIAGALKLPLYKIDLSATVSKYIGETEKNLARLFDEAEAREAILFFDEADALFGKRSSVQDAHDRYANIEVSYLLQRIDAYNGVTILATNLRANMDEAFTRRLHFAIDFPFPDVDDRKRIWKALWPAELPRNKDVDFAALARKHKLAGGGISNIIVSAAYLAARAGHGQGTVTAAHVAHGVKREMQKMGRLASVSAEGNG